RIYSALYDAFGDTEGDRQRFLAVVLKARELTLKKYHAPFMVILWDAHGNSDRTTADWIAQNLRQNQIPLLQLSTSLPSLEADDYYIPGDGHPNGRAYAVVARALNSFLATHSYLLDPLYLPDPSSALGKAASSSRPPMGQSNSN